MKLTPLDRRYYVAMGVLTYATLAVLVLLFVFGVIQGDVWTLLWVLLLILVPFGVVGRALRNAPREPPHESN